MSTSTENVSFLIPVNRNLQQTVLFMTLCGKRIVLTVTDVMNVIAVTVRIMNLITDFI